MNIKKLIIAIVVVFIGISFTDFLIHQVLLKSSYAATHSLWRKDMAEGGHMVWIFVGEALAAITFTTLWAAGFASGARITCGVKFGLFMALFSQSNSLITFAVQPIPGSLIAKWIAAAAVQGVLLGLIAFFVYKPAAK